MSIFNRNPPAITTLDDLLTVLKNIRDYVGITAGAPSASAPVRKSRTVLASGTFVVPADVHVIEAVLGGAGASGSGGGGGSGTGSTPGGGGGGKSGDEGDVVGMSMPVTPGETLTITIGDGHDGGIGGLGGDNAVGGDGAEGADGDDTTITGLYGTLRAPGGLGTHAGMTSSTRAGKGGTGTGGGFSGNGQFSGVTGLPAGAGPAHVKWNLGPGGLNNGTNGQAHANGGGGGYGAMGGPGFGQKAQQAVGTGVGATGVTGGIAHAFTRVKSLFPFASGPIAPGGSGATGGGGTHSGSDGSDAIANSGGGGGGGGGGAGIPAGGHAGDGGKGGKGASGFALLFWDTAT